MSEDHPGNALRKNAGYSDRIIHLLDGRIEQ
jgi:hypothetical protein